MGLENLQELWTHAPPGHLSALEQCKAWALREVAKDAGEDVNMALVARKLKVKGGGSPSREAVRQLYERMDEGGWFPGKKEYKSKPGPAPVLTTAKKRRIADTAMNLKKREVAPGLEPSGTSLSPGAVPPVLWPLRPLALAPQHQP